MRKRKREGRERERNTVRKKAKKSFIIDQRNRVLLPSPIAHSIQVVFDFPLKIRASPVYLWCNHDLQVHATRCCGVFDVYRV